MGEIIISLGWTPGSLGFLCLGDPKRGCEQREKGIGRDLVPLMHLDDERDQGQYYGYVGHVLLWGS